MGTRWWLLAEDPRHERLALHVARALKLNDQPVKVWRAPSGAGSASAWVIKRFAERLCQTTRKRPKEQVALLVMLDGDNEGVLQRKRQLDEALIQAGQVPRQDGEPVALLIPTWSVETWLLDVSDESTSVKQRLRSGEETAAMFERVATRLQKRRLEGAAASLADARAELDRV